MRRLILFLLLVAAGFFSAYGVEVATFGQDDAFQFVVAISVPEDKAKEGAVAFERAKAFFEQLSLEDSLHNAAISLVLTSNDFSRLPEDLRPEVPEGAAEVISRLERTGGAVILLLPEEEAGQTVVKCGVKGKTSPPELVSALITQLERGGLAWRLEESHLELYRIGWVPENHILKAYFDAGVPAVALSTSANVLPTIAEAVRLLSALSSLDAAHGFSAQNYIMLEVPSILASAINRLARAFLSGKGQGGIPLAHVAAERFVMLSEWVMVSITVIFFSVFLLYTCVLFLSRPAARKRLARNFFKALPFAAVFAAVNFVAIRLGGAFASALVAARFGKTEAWALLPRAALLTKLFFAFFFSSALSTLRGRFRLLRDPVSIGYTAAIAALINIVVFSALEFSMSGYFILCYMIVFAFAHTRSIAAKALLAALAASVFAHLYAQIFAGNTAAISALYSNEGGWNLLAAFFALPFQLMVIGIAEKTASRFVLALKLRLPAERRVRARLPLIPLASLAALIAAAAALLSVPAWSREKPLPVLIRESVAGGSMNVSIDASVALKDVALKAAQGEDASIADLPIEDFIRVDFTSRDFLDRKVFEIEIAPRVKSRRIDICILSDSGIAVNISPFPFKMDEGGREAIFSSSENPETPFLLSFITGTAGALHAEIYCWSTDNPFGLYIDDENIEASNLLFVKKEITLSDGN